MEQCENYPSLLDKHDIKIDKMESMQRWLDERIGHDIKQSRD